MAQPRHSPALPALVILAAVLLAGALPLAADGLNVRKTMLFAAEMAELGNWREASYRWESVLERREDDPAVLNNLAVAYEALGRLDDAAEFYRRSLTVSSGEPRTLDNFRRFDRFRRRLEEDRRAGIDVARSEDDEDLEADAEAAADDEAWPTREDLARFARNEKKRFGKVSQVTVALPLPPKLDIGDRETVLIASFLTEANALLDTNRELVRFLRSEFRKRTSLEVVDIVPPPAIPEQRVQDLLVNSEFWKYLAREYGADLIVSGTVRFTREDASGFRDVDTVSPATGQKIRETRFVEQEEFIYVIDVFFIDGASGALLFRDRVTRSVIFRARNNDPITAFYEMSDSLADDILAVIVPRVRVENRYVFRTG